MGRATGKQVWPLVRPAAPRHAGGEHARDATQYCAADWPLSGTGPPRSTEKTRPPLLVDGKCGSDWFFFFFLPPPPPSPPPPPPPPSLPAARKRQGRNSFTASIVALLQKTGKALKWFYQRSTRHPGITTREHVVIFDAGARRASHKRARRLAYMLDRRPRASRCPDITERPVPTGRRQKSLADPADPGEQASSRRTARRPQKEIGAVKKEAIGPLAKVPVESRRKPSRPPPRQAAHHAQRAPGGVSTGSRRATTRSPQVLRCAAVSWVGRGSAVPYQGLARDYTAPTATAGSTGRRRPARSPRSTRHAARWLAEDASPSPATQAGDDRRQSFFVGPKRGQL